jgi:hypothetical protein
MEPFPSSIEISPPASEMGTGAALVLPTVTLVGTVTLEMVTDPPSRVTGTDPPEGPQTSCFPKVGMA